MLVDKKLIQNDYIPFDDHRWGWKTICGHFLHIAVGGGGSVGEKVKEPMSANIFKQVT